MTDNAPPFLQVDMVLTKRTTRLFGYTADLPPGTVIKRTALPTVWIDEFVFATQGTEPPQRITVQISAKP